MMMKVKMKIREEAEVTKVMIQFIIQIGGGWIYEEDSGAGQQ